MAKPDCDDGWLRYAHELDAALAIADFSKLARVVLHEVFTQMFGPHKRRTAMLLSTDIARRVGTYRQNVRAAIRELVDAGVLRSNPDDSFSFLKDYESWTRSSRPRLTPDEVDYCRAAPAFVMSLRHAKRRNASTKKGIPLDSKPNESGIPLDSMHGIPLDYKKESNGIPQQYIGARAELRLKKGSSLNSNDDDPGHAGAVVVVAGKGGRDPSRDRPPAAPDPELIATQDHARATFPGPTGEAFARSIAVQAEDVKARLGDRWDCLRAAIDRAARPRKDAINDLYPWCLRVAATIVANGEATGPVPVGPSAAAGSSLDEKKARLRKRYQDEEKQS